MKKVIIILIFLGFAVAQEERLTLKSCITMALKSSLELRNSEESLRQAGLNKIVNYAPFYPSVNLSVSDKLLGFDNNGADIPVFSVNPDTYSASLNVSYNLYNMFKDYDQYRFSEKKYAEAELSVILKKQDLSYRVVTAYYDVLSLEKTLQIREKTLEQKKEYLKLAETLFKAGIRPKSDYLNALIQIKKSEVSLIDGAMSTKIAKAKLNALIGLLPDKELLLEEDGEFLPVGYSYELLQERLFKDNFDWKKINLQYEYTAILTSLSERALLPSLSIDASYSLALDKYLGSSSNWTHAGRLDQNSNWGVEISLSYPLFDGEANVSGYKTNRGSLNIARINIDILKRDLTEQIYSAFLNVNRVFGELELLKLQVAFAKENLDLIKNRYQTGISSFLDLIDAELHYAAAEISYNQAIYDYKTSSYAIEKLCGTVLFK